MDADDRLSSLPDDVISHILSFLQTEYAVGTAVLSRRWKDLWTRVSYLDFDNSWISEGVPEDIVFMYRPPHEWVQYANDRVQRRVLEFHRFVDKVLSQHKNLDSVRRLRFRYHFHFLRGLPELNWSPGFWFQSQWVFVPLIEEMDIGIYGDIAVEATHCMSCLPQSFYTLKNLRIVKLEGVTLSAAAKGSVLLPSMKILQLCDVKIADCESFSSLISGCPVLETALLNCCYILFWNELDVLVVSSPSLKNLEMNRMISFDDSLTYHIAIETPNLEELHLDSFAGLKFIGSSPLSCLNIAHVDVGQCPISYHALDEVLNYVSNAKEVFLSGKPLNQPSAPDNVQLRVFPNLTHLTIGKGGSNWILHSLLNSASKLQSLVIDLGTPLWNAEWEILENLRNPYWNMEWEISEHHRTPECLLSSLEEIKINGLVGTEDQRKLIAYLLKAGTLLKKMNMHIDSNDIGIEDHENFVPLLKLPRGSSRCEARVFLHINREIRIDRYDGTHIVDVVRDYFEGIDDGTDS